MPGMINLVPSAMTTSAVNQIISSPKGIGQIQLLQGSQTVPVQINGELVNKNLMNVPVQVMTSPDDTSVYVLTVSIEEPKEDGKKKEDVIYQPIENENTFPEPQCTSTPKSPDEDVQPMNETIIAGNVELNTGVQKEELLYASTRKQEAVAPELRCEELKLNSETAFKSPPQNRKGPPEVRREEFKPIYETVFKLPPPAKKTATQNIQELKKKTAKKFLDFGVKRKRSLVSKVVKTMKRKFVLVETFVVVVIATIGYGIQLKIQVRVI